MSEERAVERARCLAKVADVASYYALDIFSEITIPDAAEIARIDCKHPGLIDRISASMGRLCCKNIAAAIEKDDE